MAAEVLAVVVAAVAVVVVGVERGALVVVVVVVEVEAGRGALEASPTLVRLGLGPAPGVEARDDVDELVEDLPAALGALKSGLLYS